MNTYFIQHSVTDNIKIGQSENPEQRLNDLQTGAGGAELSLLGYTDQVSESDLHNRFNHLRVKGEWFKPKNELIVFINHVCRYKPEAKKKELTNTQKLIVRAIISLESEIKNGWLPVKRITETVNKGISYEIKPETIGRECKKLELDNKRVAAGKSVFIPPEKMDSFRQILILPEQFCYKKACDFYKNEIDIMMISGHTRKDACCLAWSKTLLETGVDLVSSINPDFLKSFYRTSDSTDTQAKLILAGALACVRNGINPTYKAIRNRSRKIKQISRKNFDKAACLLEINGRIKTGLNKQGTKKLYIPL